MADVRELLLIPMAVICVGGVRTAVLLWKGDPSFRWLPAVFEPPKWSPFAGPGWRAMWRCHPLIVLFMWGILLGGLFKAAGSNSGIVVFTIFGSLSGVLAVGVGLFAWPQRLVPPPLRGRPGAVSEWRTALQSRRRRRASRP